MKEREKGIKETERQTDTVDRDRQIYRERKTNKQTETERDRDRQIYKKRKTNENQPTNQTNKQTKIHHRQTFNTIKNKHQPQQITVKE